MDRRLFLKISCFSLLEGANLISFGKKYQVIYTVIFPKSQNFSRNQFYSSQGSYEKPEVIQEITKKYINRGQLFLQVELKDDRIERSYTFLTKNYYRQWQGEVKALANFNNDNAEKKGFIIMKTKRWVS